MSRIPVQGGRSVDRSIDYDDWSSYGPTMALRSCDSAPVGPTVRPVGGGDLPALLAHVARCSPDALYRRYHGPAGPWLRDELARVVASAGGRRSWVAEAAGEIRGTATLAPGRDGTVEVAFLVEDGWSRRGVATSLFEALRCEAGRTGAPQITAMVQADNTAAVRFLRHVAPSARVRYAGGSELEVTVPVPRVTAAAERPATAGPRPAVHTTAA
jgi:GNAT superfamily N-acetyltransferase